MTIPAGETVDVTVVTPPKTEVTVTTHHIDITIDDRPAPVINTLIAGSLIQLDARTLPGGSAGRASRWFWGVGDPANADPQAVPGDEFLDQSNFDVYGYTAPVNLTPGGP